MPLDDRDLKRAGAWSLQKDSAARFGTLARTVRAGASLSLTTTAARIQVLASTCARCGSVRVVQGTKVVATISLRSGKVVRSKAFTIAKLKPGVPIKLVSMQAGREVRIDGVVLLR